MFEYMNLEPDFLLSFFFRLSSLERKVGRYKKFEEYLLRVIDVMPEGGYHSVLKK